MGKKRALRREGKPDSTYRQSDIQPFLALVIVGWLMVFSVGYEEFRNMRGSFLSTSAETSDMDRHLR